MAAINFTRSKEVTSKRILMRQKRCRRKSSLFGTCGPTPALVLSLYILTTSPHSATDDTSQGEHFDLSEADFDWKIVGDGDISDLDNASMALSDSSNWEQPAVKFIRFGARYAQRKILEFASLLDEVA
ncbi:hypothetical protein PENSOL_c142G05925 [Penicillium solitum]|uniref:Uncharacterized protein n=1 Tax=Penicillium solitum TaxID=60172 RepID=A0A1V6Q353_9EURO|nr:uncharacterized protein PENSOL_c142G05925 [Penicillium solitum]OQD83661.1 hypothetical protein PENSOL_c142G05925 [Penicillium solitum]